MTMTDVGTEHAHSARRAVLAIGTIEATRIILEAQGHFSRTEVPLIRERILELANAGVRHFVVQACPTTAFSSEALTELMRLADALTTSGGSLHIDDRSPISTPLPTESSLQR